VRCIHGVVCRRIEINSVNKASKIESC
jgi:hypothetical protein